MKRIIYILTGIVLLSLSSCSDFLEPKSQSEYVPKDANALQEMLIGSAYPKQDKSNFLLPFLSFLDDDIQFHKTDYEFSINSLKNIEAKQAVYTWQPDMFFIMERNGYPLQNIWEGYYNYILGANAARTATGCAAGLAGGYHADGQPSTQRGTGTAVQGAYSLSGLFLQREMGGVPCLARSCRGCGKADADRAVGKRPSRYGL